MSYTFSRRDFMKYSALTVVAVAGAGLLSGCEIQDPNNPVVEIGKKNTIGTTTALVTLADNENGKVDGKFKISITNGSEVPLQVLPSNFVVTITDDDKKTVVYTSNYGLMKVRDADDTTDHYADYLQKGSADYTVTDTDFKLPETAGSYTVLFRYTPNTFEGQLSIGWRTKVVVEDTSASEGGDTTDTDGE